MKIKLTPGQEEALRKAALAEVRPMDQMLTLLLAEGLRFYFSDREPLLYGVTFNEIQVIDELMDELVTICQLKDMKASIEADK